MQNDEPWEKLSSNMWFVARWLDVPASSEPRWRGRDDMMENRKRRHMESWRPTPAEEKHGYFHALQIVFLGAPLDQYLARLLYLSFCMASEFYLPRSARSDLLASAVAR